jgi:catechol 2,3-dioxygenase-like lactoylglutathione lyase family enzyme
VLHEPECRFPPLVRLFHYHLVTSKVREVEARYLAKLGFKLIARYGRLGEEQQHFEAGVPWDELDRMGFKLRLTELERGAVNVVVQPGQWALPRLDHFGLALEEDEFEDTLARAESLRLRVQEYPGRRTFIATGAGYRLEVHPPRDWVEEVLSHENELRLNELQLRSEAPDAQASAFAEVLDLIADGAEVHVADTVVRFLPGGPAGRPELYAELFG